VVKVGLLLNDHDDNIEIVMEYESKSWPPYQVGQVITLAEHDSKEQSAYRLGNFVLPGNDSKTVRTRDYRILSISHVIHFERQKYETEKPLFHRMSVFVEKV